VTAERDSQGQRATADEEGASRRCNSRLARETVDRAWPVPVRRARLLAPAIRYHREPGNVHERALNGSSRRSCGTCTAPDPAACDDDTPDSSPRARGLRRLQPVSRRGGCEPFAARLEGALQARASSRDRFAENRGRTTSRTTAIGRLSDVAPVARGERHAGRGELPGVGEIAARNAATLALLGTRAGRRLWLGRLSTVDDQLQACDLAHPRSNVHMQRRRRSESECS